jgi:hypothetical protein
MLVSPPVALTGGNRATLHFWQSYDFPEPDVYEFGAVYVSTNNGNSWPELPVATFEESSFGWEEAEIDLTPYVGRVIRLGFYYGLFTLENQAHPGWLVDDISIVVTNSIQQFAFKSVAFTNGQAYLTLVAPAGSPYVIEASADLVNWTPLRTNTGTSGDSSFIDIQSTNFSSRFYRLRK